METHEEEPLQLDCGYVFIDVVRLWFASAIAWLGAIKGWQSKMEWDLVTGNCIHLFEVDDDSVYWYAKKKNKKKKQ